MFINHKKKAASLVDPKLPSIGQMLLVQDLGKSIGCSTNQRHFPADPFSSSDNFCSTGGQFFSIKSSCI